MTESELDPEGWIACFLWLFLFTCFFVALTKNTSRPHCLPLLLPWWSRFYIAGASDRTDCFLRFCEISLSKLRTKQSRQRLYVLGRGVSATSRPHGKCRTHRQPGVAPGPGIRVMREAVIWTDKMQQLKIAAGFSFPFPSVSFLCHMPPCSSLSAFKHLISDHLSWHGRSGH